MNDLNSLVQLLLVTTNLLFLAYLVVFAVARQSSYLFGAVALELVAFAGLLWYRKWTNTRKSTQRESALLERVERSFSFLRFLRWGYGVCMVSVLALVGIYFAVDLTALLLGSCGKAQLSESIYEGIAPPKCSDLHPAYSLELLAGAYIEAGNYDEALRLANELMQIRKAVRGPVSESTAEMYCNMGDLYRKSNEPREAEAAYRNSIAITKVVHVPHGYGSPMTKLGCLLRDEGRFAEAEQCFQQAMQIRTEIFGGHSIKVCETELEYAKVLRLQGKTEAGIRMGSHATAEVKRKERHSETDGWSEKIMLAMPAIVLLTTALFRGRLLGILARIGDTWRRRR